MNDRFKFRLWHNGDKKYHDADYTSSKLGQDGCLWQYGNPEDDEEYTIEQCTGLTDKNGKLIYEGDVVVKPNQYPYFDYADDVPHKSLNDTFGVIEHNAVQNYIGIVEWDEENAQFVIVLQCVNPSKSGISNGCCHYFGEDENLEIIGNIHDKEVCDE